MSQNACTCADPRITVGPCPLHPKPLPCGALPGQRCKPAACGWCRLSAEMADEARTGAAGPALTALDRVLASPDAEPLCLADAGDRQRLRDLVAGQLGEPKPGDRQPSPLWKRDEFGGEEYLRIGPLELIVGAIAWTVRVVATQAFDNGHGGQVTTRYLEDLVAGMGSTTRAAKLAAEDAAIGLLAAWTKEIDRG